MKRTKGIRSGLLLLLGIGVSACAADGTWRPPVAEPTLYPPDVFSHQVASSHVVLYWNCARPEPGLLRLEGVAHNPWGQQEVRFLELEVVGVDGRERAVSQAATAIPDFLLRTNEISPFRRELRMAATEVRFDLFYQYRFQDDGGRFMAGAPVRVPRLLAQSHRFMARDGCSETQHRVR